MKIKSFHLNVFYISMKMTFYDPDAESNCSPPFQDPLLLLIKTQISLKICDVVPAPVSNILNFKLGFYQNK